MKSSARLQRPSGAGKSTGGRSDALGQVEQVDGAAGGHEQNGTVDGAV